jgi:hypothetical protein
MKFSDLNFQPHAISSGIHAVAKFPNNYGLSVVKFPGSYGYEFNQYECAVVKFIEDDFEVVYNTQITDDVVGYCTSEEVENLLQQVESL